jgi:hypothetical protein
MDSFRTPDVLVCIQSVRAERLVHRVLWAWNFPTESDDRLSIPAGNYFKIMNFISPSDLIAYISAIFLT